MAYERPHGSEANFTFSGDEYVRPIGSAANFGTGALQGVLAHGGDSLELGAPGVRNQLEFLFAHGADALVFGWHTARDPLHYVRPHGLHADFQFGGEYTRPDGAQAHFGDAPSTPTIFASPINTLAFGQAEIRNASHFVVGAGAIPPRGGYGVAGVQLFARYVVPAGVDAQVFGTQWASHWLRSITAASAGDKTARGTPWVSRSPRELAPAGVQAPQITETHVVGGTRYIEPAGTDMTQWGTRIIPEGQVLYPAGFSGEYGRPQVQNKTSYARPQGFQTYQDALRFGQSHAWNLRQIARQDYDSSDGLNPPGFGQWTGIENRNKAPVPVGWLSERIGYQFVWNKASPVVPTGIKEPPTGAGSVTHWRRLVTPDGIDSLASERWHATFNKAAPLRAQGSLHQDFGRPALENRSRLYDKVGNLDTLALGTPMVSYAVRTLEFESRYTIEPPAIALPAVKLHTRYVEHVSAGEQAGVGVPVLDIRWTIIAPKWAFHPPAWIGEPALHNVTPELRTGGANHEEFGHAAVRTQWRRVETREGDMVRWGKPVVRDRRQWVEFVTVGAPPALAPGPGVTKNGGFPDPQGIQPAGFGPGYGQVPNPVAGALMARARGDDMLATGHPLVTANSIRVEPGYGEFLMGEPTTTLKNRSLGVEGIKPVTDVGRPRFSPFTIYSVMEAPAQAKMNHPAPRILHYVDYDQDLGVPLTGPGKPRISHWTLKVAPYGAAPPQWQVAAPVLEPMRRYVGVNGFLGMRFGMPSVPGDQIVAVYDAIGPQGFGLHGVGRPPYIGPQTVAPAGAAPPAIAQPSTEFKDRVRHANGWDSLALGASRQGDQPFQWQGLRVGPLVPNIPTGFDAQQHGTAWVSLKVRDVAMQGFDAMEAGYDIENFDQRMRVKRAAPLGPYAQHIAAQGTASHRVGTPGAKLSAHFIRPDGNAEQYRKGAP